MAGQQQRSFGQRAKWWWNTRVKGLFRVRLKSLFRRDISAVSAAFGFEHRAAELAAPDAEGITVILTAYRRTQYLAEQVAAIREQSVPVAEIWLWTNASPDELRDFSSLVDRVVVSNTNWLFWGRFALGNLARTGYVAFFDDDVLPQPEWFANCLATIDSGFDGILGGSGVMLPAQGGYASTNKAGWNGAHHAEVTEVDLVGHAWFLRKQYLQYMWREEPVSWDNGEDIHLSYMALKHGGIHTFVPPHPEDDLSRWSCRPDFGKIVGRTSSATFKGVDHRRTRSDIVDAYRDDGWQIVAERGGVEPRSFSGDLRKFNRKLGAGVNFALVRFGDGEMAIINGDAIDLSQKHHGEHKYTPQNAEDEKYRRILEQSLLYKADYYFVGLPCRCCVGDRHCDELRAQSTQDESQMTWANIFVNANYEIFQAETVPLLNKRRVNIVCHENAEIGKLPFAVRRDFRVGGNAWVKDYQRLLGEMAAYIDDNRVRGEVFLFCAGVLSNMLIYELAKRYPDNTYIDLGSVFDVVMGLGATRKYLKGSRKRLKKVCVW